ncbi:heme o synthase [Isosphaeraceae bacterium EP7]
MKTATPVDPAGILADPGLATGGREWLAARLQSYTVLTKLRLVTMVLVTVAAGFMLGAKTVGRVSGLPLLAALVGTGMVAAGASAWNQYLERDRDALMRRTAKRPLPAGKIAPLEAAALGTALALAGLAILVLATRQPAAWLALLTFVLYVFAYTPLKPITTLNTAIGAIPGALPPVIGWAAATGRVGIEAWALFFIVFLWQFPHFLAIAWIHRADYARGGHLMLPNVDPEGKITGRQAMAHALALVPASLLPCTVGMAGPWYFAGAFGLGLYYLTQATRFWMDVNDASARRLLYTSFLYLPAILLLLLLNPSPA